MVMGDMILDTEVLVIGSGPGGYAAAFRAADLGLDVTMVDPEPRPGGVCLHRGCIPSKTFLYLAELIFDARRAQPMGVSFSEPRIDLETMRAWKQTVIDRMANGLISLCDSRGVQMVTGTARFENSNTVVLQESEVSRIKFRKAIIATGSRPIALPGTEFVQGSRIMSSAGALELTDIPTELLIVGGGYVGLELGMFYGSLGSRITLVELADRLLATVDRDLVIPLQRRLQTIFKGIHLQTGIVAMEENQDSVEVTLEGPQGSTSQRFDRVLVSIGRRPNSEELGLDQTSARVNQAGFIEINERQQTADPNILAVGDVVGGIMLAHKATREGKVAAEVIAGEPSAFDARAIPAVVYTDPQVAWCGLTEEQAKAFNTAVKVHKFPWKYSGRAHTMGATDGFTKILTDPDSGRVLGLGITGRNTEGLIAEGVLAIEMGALAEDIALSLHAHPTLSETEGEAAELFLGSATHILGKKKGGTNK